MLLILILLLFGCSRDTSPTVFTGNAMTIDYRILVGSHLNPAEQLKVENTIRETFQNVNATFNKFNPNSELSFLNSLPAGKIVQLSPELADLITQTQDLVRLTKGMFDPTIEPLQQLWKEKLSEGKEPTVEEISLLKPALGWDKIHIEGNEFYKDHSLTRLDLGGIAKGYCVDQLIERLQKLGYPDLFVEWGGEIRTAGEHPEKRPWRVFISKLGSDDPQDAIAHVDLNNQAIATSGDYMQFWHIQEKTYTHVFDPHSYRPLEVTPNSIASASVLAPTCTFADGIAKVGMLFRTLEEAQNWAEEIRTHYPETQFWFVTRE